MICVTFHGEPPSEKHHAAHKNGNERDNRPLNLYWATPVQNEKDKAMHGRTANGERCGRSKLKNKQVLVIRTMIEAGIKRKDIAANYGVSVSTIALIAQNKKWRQIV